jgi:hypothetical protein
LAALDLPPRPATKRLKSQRIHRRDCPSNRARAMLAVLIPRLDQVVVEVHQLGRRRHRQGGRRLFPQGKVTQSSVAVSLARF